MAESIKVSEEAVKKIHSRLECSICLETFKEPKLLPCFHIFCKSPCLEKLVIHGPKEQSLTCPTCRRHVTLPDNGVAGLQTDFHFEGLLEIRDSLNPKKRICENCKKSSVHKYCQQCRILLCQKCTEIHQLWGHFHDHKLLEMNEIEVGASVKVNLLPKCLRHPEMEAKVYCRQCSELICSDCAISHHRSHEYDLTMDVFQEQKEEIFSSLANLKEIKDKVQQALDCNLSREKEIDQLRATVEGNLSNEIEELHQLLDRKKEELVNSLDKTIQHKKNCLAIQRDQIGAIHTKMSSCVEYTEACLEGGRVSDILRMKPSIVERIKKMTKDFDSSTLQPEVEAKIQPRIPDETVIKQIQQACLNLAPMDSMASNIDAESFFYGVGDGLKTAESKEKTAIKICCKAEKDASTKKLGLCAKLVHVNTKTVFECEIRQENDQHLVIYEPQLRGKHSLHIKIDSNHICGSPFDVTVTPSSESFSKPMEELSNRIIKVHAIAVDKKGCVIILAGTTFEGGIYPLMILVMTPKGEKIFEICNIDSCTEDDYSNYAFGIAIDHEDSIYITTRSGIRKYTSEGEHEKFLSFECPAGVCFNKTSHLLYVCDQKRFKIQVLTTDLATVRSFSTNGIIYCPNFVAFDNFNNLFVAVYYEERGHTSCNFKCHSQIQVFTAEGDFVRYFLTQQSVRLWSISFDSGNTMYAHFMEYSTPRLKAYTSDGHFIKQLNAQKEIIDGRKVKYSFSLAFSMFKDDSIIIIANLKRDSANRCFYRLYIAVV